MKELTLQELKEVEFEILKVFDAFCKENNITYYLSHGTLIGAVRYKKFIPWDDDIDIGMPRDDYEKFIEVANKELKQPFFCSCFNEKHHNGYCCRVVDKNIVVCRDDAMVKKKENLWIDVFPLDGMPNNCFTRFFHKNILLFLRLLLQYSKFKNGINMKKKRNIVEIIFIKLGYVVSKVCCFDVKKRLLAIDKTLRRYNYDTSDYVVNFMGAYKFKEMFPRKLYEEVVEYQFEDLMLCAPKDYDVVLSQMYGDYMTPPKKDKRYGHDKDNDIIYQ